MKKRLFLFFCIFSVIESLSAQMYIAFDDVYSNENYENHGQHYVIDNHVNVRDSNGMHGNKLFQLNAGDKVQIIGIDLNEELFYADGYYAHWLKISCSKGEGYICARYVSCKEVKGDFDGDGSDEIFACISLSDDKNCPIREYRMSFDNVDKEHVLIKNGTVTYIDLESMYGDRLYKDPYYSCVSADGLRPHINFLTVRIGFGDGGGAWSNEKYYYFSKNGKLKYFSELDYESYEMAEDHIEEFEFYGNKAKKIIKHTEWEDCKIKSESTDEVVYEWDGENFR